MKISEDFRQFAAEPGVTEQKSVAKGMNEKSAEFKWAGSEIYQKV
jgi:phosphomethylpyrimidine synthase